jgi:hypothetical protein
VKAALLGALALGAVSVTPGLPPRIQEPPGWEAAGFHVEDYELGVDPEGGPEGGPCPRFASLVPRPEGFVGISRSVDATAYRGRRLALSALVRTEEVTGWAGLWMRIDSREHRSQVFDYMEERPIRGSSGWLRYRVVLDVPEAAINIFYGAALSGAGAVWADGFALEAVGPEVPTTEPEASKLRALGLDFEPPAATSRTSPGPAPPAPPRP